MTAYNGKHFQRLSASATIFPILDDATLATHDPIRQRPIPAIDPEAVANTNLLPSVPPSYLALLMTSHDRTFYFFLIFFNYFFFKLKLCECTYFYTHDEGSWP